LYTNFYSTAGQGIFNVSWKREENNVSALPRKKANRSCGRGTDGNRSREGDISLNGLTEAPVVFLAFAMGETASP